MGLARSFVYGSFIGRLTDLVGGSIHAVGRQANSRPGSQAVLRACFAGMFHIPDSHLRNSRQNGRDPLSQRGHDQPANRTPAAMAGRA